MTVTKKMIDVALKRCPNSRHIHENLSRKKGAKIHFEWCSKNNVVPAEAKNLDCLCPIIIKRSHPNYDRFGNEYECPNPEPDMFVWPHWDHLSFFRSVHGLRRICVAVFQPYWQSNDETAELKESLERWVAKKNLRLIFDLSDDASWWNQFDPGKGPHLGGCYRIEIWNDARR